MTEAVENEFGFAEIKVISFAGLYAGKLVAALDRQHPRDMFDVRDLLANEGITDDLRQAFIVYLLSHKRPKHEILASPQKDISEEFLRGFEGMTEESVKLEELLTSRAAMIKSIVGQMPEVHRKFLLSFEQGKPDWALLGVKGAEDLPTVKWRQYNLDKLTPEDILSRDSRKRSSVWLKGRNAASERDRRICAHLSR